MDYTQDPTQGADRITQILQSRVPQQSVVPMPLPAEMPQPVPPQEQMKITDILKQKIASGDPQATALDKRVKMFVGDDPTAYDSAVQFLNDHPDEIDPTNSYQTSTALAQWSKQSGYHKQATAPRQMPTNQQFAMQDLANIASGKGTDILGLQQDAAKNAAAIDALAAKASGTGSSAFATVMSQINSDPQLSQLPMIEKIRLAQNKVGTNLTVDPKTGQVIDMGGAAEGLGNLEYGKKYGGTTGDLTAQGQLKPGVEGAVETAKNAADIAAAGPKKLAETSAANQGEAIAKLGQVEDNADFLTREVSALLTHPGMETALGKQSYFPSIRGSDAYNFENRLKQVKGAAFLSAFDTLRGGGSISNTEGDKATAAKNRMEAATSKEEFVNAANDFLTIVNTAKTRARMQAQGNFGGQNEATPPSKGGVVHFNDLPD